MSRIWQGPSSCRIRLVNKSAGAIRMTTERVRRDGRDRAALRVANDGPPIPQEVRDRLFEPFVTSRENGTGLGLAIAAQIVDAHGGEIEVDAGAGGEGGEVAFAVLLPLG